MIGFRKHVQKNSHINDPEFHSFVHRRILSKGKNSSGNPTKEVPTYNEKETFHTKDAKLLHKHGFLAGGAHYTDGTSDVMFDKHKLKELNGIIHLAHSIHAIGLNASKKKS